MAVRNLWLLGVGLAACLVLCGDGYPQQPPTPTPVVPPDPVPAPIAPVASTPAPEPSVDRLLDRLVELRRQKAELERQEQLLVKQLRNKLKAQAELLEKLGIAPEPKEEVKAESLPAIPPPTSTR